MRIEKNKVMIKADLNQYFLWKDELVKVIAINQGYKSISFEPVNKPCCPTCGQRKVYEIIESSPLFQENAKPLETLTAV